jgi:(1->4)-alpha-D-glucan 1-alpha-D-glucosylmutase
MRIPVATYRLQLHKDFGFRAVGEILRYLSELGISDIYASPIFKARKGSLHGYDVVDPGQINPDLGSPSDYEQLAEAVKGLKMGWLQDVVPNHMAYDAENEMLMDVLENGTRSPYFESFDVFWDHPYASLKGRVLAPFLGKFYGEALEEGEIKILFDRKGFRITYYELSFPLKLESYPHLLTHGLKTLRRKLGRNHPHFIKLLGILYVLKTLSSQEGGEDGYEQVTFIKNTLWEVYTQSPEIRDFVDENLRVFNGERDAAERVRSLDPLLSEQLFRLSFWKVATEEINYRRFFSINDLISLRVERQEVFRHTHALIFRLLKEEKFTGLRIDHIDGLFDPEEYLNRLKEQGKNLYMVVEKILDPEEELPSSWPVQGTSGYEFLNMVNLLFCRDGRAMSRIYMTFTGLKEAYQDLVKDKKKLILERHMTGDVDNLAHLLKAISSRDRHGSDITLSGLKRALTEVMVSFPVYRTYVNSEQVRDEDRSSIRRAVTKARESNPDLSHELDFVERFLLLELEKDLSEEEKAERLGFVMRFQQFTGPLMAKGFEDTTLYVYNRLVSLNDVGGTPDRLGISPERFHDFNLRRMERWPHSLSATATHDTKRGEDVRTRINALTELTDEWEGRLKEWNRINRAKKRKVRGVRVPEPNDEYFLYQTLLGAFPSDQKAYPQFVERMKRYIIKSVREAKVHTAWLKPDEEYERAYTAFLEDVLRPSEGNLFLEAFLPFQKKIAWYGLWNSLSQALIKITAPGVPDFYQGCELWDLNLVDPDNRRPVDYEARGRFLREIKAKEEKGTGPLIAELLSTKEDGRIKLFLIYRALKARKEHIQIFRGGDYLPLAGEGLFRDCVIAFARRYGDDWAVVTVPRFLTAIAVEGEYPLGEEKWKDTRVLLPKEAPRVWINALTGESIEGDGNLPVGNLLGSFPVCLLIKETRQES